MRAIIKPIFLAIVSLLVGSFASAMSTNELITLDDVNYSVLPGDRVRVELKLSSPVGEPQSFAIHRPARIVLDLPDVSMNLARKSRLIDIGVASSITVAEAGGRTRVVLNLVRMVPYSMRVVESSIFITLGSLHTFFGTGFPDREYTITRPQAVNIIESIEFRRARQGEGRITVTLANSAVVANTRQEGDQLIVDFPGADLRECLEQHLDVVDFATPILSVDTFVFGDNVRMVVETIGTTEQLVYQSNNRLTIDIKSSTQ